MELDSRPVWVEIHLERIAHNLAEVRKRVGPSPEIMAVVKADAYGHGASYVAGAALEAGASRLAVAYIEEGVYLRQQGFQVPIQAMAGLLPQQIDLALEWDITMSLGDLQMAQEVSSRARANKKEAIVHIKVDTGMGRYGIPTGQSEMVRDIYRLPELFVEGVFTHMATADELDKSFSREQFKRFAAIIQELKTEGLEIPLRHVSNSATVIDLPEMALDLVRPGIMMYGLWPSQEVKKDVVFLKPVLEWKALVAQVKELPAGHPVSYGRTYHTPGKARVALLPVGYADGYSRSLSNKGYVLIRGQRAPIRGRVCMDQFVVDVTRIPNVKVNDEAVLIGVQGEQSIDAHDLAQIQRTINYEVVATIGKRVPRFYR